MKILLSLIFLILAISSCTSKVNHGYMFEYSDAHLIDIGSDKNFVFNIMGSPTFKSQLDNESWIYMHEQTKSFLFFRPKIIQREIIILDFAGNNVVDISKINLEDQAKNFKFEANFTEVEEHKTGFLKSLFSNVGQVRAQ